ncbi:MAG: zf-HC2 domain-containing protein [Candidatus Hydrogenedentes bacterium]|nr:zf-HC2 domain-containing protein [Candidatus Hydrogenedentota bacterium]
MKCQTVQHLLDDYVDGLLIGEEPALVARHLASCPDCARQANGLRELLQSAKALPRHIEPHRDLWPGIRGQIEKGSKRRISRAGRFTVLALAAAVLAILAGSLLMLDHPRPLNPGLAAEAPVRLEQEVLVVEAEYQRARRELVAAMDQLPRRLAPETRTVIDQNLAVIDGAIQEIRASLEKDPENVFLFDMLVAEQDRSLQLLGLEGAITSNTW